MATLAQTSNIQPATSSTDNFNFKDFYAVQESSADKVLEKVKGCLSSLESNYQPLNVPKAEYYNYVKFHWDLSQKHYAGNEKTAKKIRNTCQKLIYQGVVNKLFDKEVVIKFQDSKDEYVKLNAFQTTLMGLLSPVIKRAFDYEFKESHGNVLSLNMSKEIFLKICDMAKTPTLTDGE